MGSTQTLEPLRCPQCGGTLPAPTASTLTCPFCGTHLILTRSRSDAAPELARGLQLRQQIVCDTCGTGAEAYRLLVPVDWEFRSHVDWHLENPMVPVISGFQAYNPGGLEAFEMLPTLGFYCSSDPSMPKRGGQYYGNTVRPLAPAQQVLKDAVLPTYRGGVSDLAVEQLEDMTEAFRQARGANPEQGNLESAARARLRYRVARHAIEEDLLCAVESTSYPIYAWGVQLQNTFWQASHLFGSRAAEGQLDRQADLFGTLFRSLRLNWQWLLFVRQLVTQLIRGQMRHTLVIGQLGAEYARMGAQMRQENYALFEQRGASYDRIADLASQTIRDVNVYFDPGLGREVELPTAYAYAWGDGQGGYILTDNPNPNPNLSSSLTWTELPRR